MFEAHQYFLRSVPSLEAPSLFGTSDSASDALPSRTAAPVRSPESPDAHCASHFSKELLVSLDRGLPPSDALRFE
jgi:hypothetical protein